MTGAVSAGTGAVVADVGEDLAPEGAEESRVLEVSVPMRWGDMDAYGHVNNVQVVRMLEEARIAAFGPPRGAGLPGMKPAVSLFDAVPEGVMSLVVEHRIRYVRTLEYRNIPAVARVWIGALKGASFEIRYELVDPITDALCVRATTQLAFVDEATGRVVRLSQEQKELLAPFHRT